MPKCITILPNGNQCNSRSRGFKLCYNHQKKQTTGQSDGHNDGHNDGLFDCQCCLESVPKSSIIKCNNVDVTQIHSVCSTCFCNHINQSIIDKKIGCMMSPSGCKGRYNDRDIKQHLNKTTCMKYLECAQIEEVALMANILDNYHICPFCSKYGVSLNDDPVDNYQDKFTINCLECKETWCCKCRNFAHYPDPCGKLNSRDKIDRIIDEVVDSAAIHTCPQCFLKYNKELGCNLITCSRCKSYSCYACGVLIEPIRDSYGDLDLHWHFKSSANPNNKSVCPLMYGTGSDADIKASNIDHDKKRVLIALENLVRKNLDDLKIAKSIYDKIVKKKYVIDKFKTIVDNQKLVTNENHKLEHRDNRRDDRRGNDRRRDDDNMIHILGIIVVALCGLYSGFVGLQAIFGKKVLKEWMIINMVLYILALARYAYTHWGRLGNDPFYFKSLLQYSTIINTLIFIIGIIYRTIVDNAKYNICDWNEIIPILHFVCQ